MRVLFATEPPCDGLPTGSFGPSKPILACVPSQNGFLFEFPQRQSAYCEDAGKALPSSHSVDSPAALPPIISGLSDTEPETLWGPLF